MVPPSDPPPGPPRGPGSALSPARQKLLARLLAAKGVKAADAVQGIPRRTDRTQPAPLTFAQEALWFLDQLEPNTALHNQPGAVRLSGQLDVAALEQALGDILGRHEALRTTFVERQGTPVQVVAVESQYSLPLTDLSGQERGAAEAEALRLATEAAGAPFDLEQGPLHRILLIRIASDEHVLVLTFHHIVTDGWSMSVFTKEFDALYRAALNGTTSGLPELPIQMADFAVWQRKNMQGAVLEEHLAYWREHLSGELASVEVPGDRPRPTERSFQGGHQGVELSKQLSDRLRALSREQGVTLFMTLDAAFLALLHHETQETDMVLGSAVAHRNRSELQPLIGFLVNMLVLRTDLSGDPTFTELLKRVRPAVLGAWSHQDLPLTRIIKEVQPERDLGRSPLFQVQFSLLTPDVNPAVYGYGLDTGSIETVQLPGLVMTPWHVPFNNARYDIAVFLWDMPAGICGTMEYARDLYDASTMERMARRYEALLTAVVERPESRLSDLVAGLQRAELDRAASAEQSYEHSMKSKLKSIRRRRARPGDGS